MVELSIIKRETETRSCSPQPSGYSFQFSSNLQDFFSYPFSSPSEVVMYWVFLPKANPRRMPKQGRTDSKFINQGSVHSQPEAHCTVSASPSLRVPINESLCLFSSILIFTSLMFYRRKQLQQAFHVLTVLINRSN